MENRKSEIEDPIDPGHRGPRDLFRVLGPVILGIGILFMVVGGVDFFSAFGGMRAPTLFWCFFVGMPLLFVGGVMCQFGYAGKVARYMAQEMAPVGKDTFNYMADGTQEGVKTVASAVGQGLAAGGVALGGKADTKVRCHKCNSLAEEGAKFCPQCGSPLGKTKPCPNCRELNDPDAKFCDNCGQTI
ncbi:MAG: zinc ribbon domain-containing protein [Phycisphaerae bacterium]|nr:zinc ribbon domain-containing protein [Phycisphaerae bacterium]